MNTGRESLKPIEWAVCITVYLLAAAFFSWLFYDSAFAMLLFAPFFILFARAVRKLKRKKLIEEMTEEFISALTGISTSLSAGVSAENAFVMAADDMEKLYGKRSVIVKELDTVNMCVRSGQTLSVALKELADRWQTDEIYDFSVVFSSAVKSGGNLPGIISSCTRIMEDRLDSETESRVMIRSRQYEQRVMCVIPPGILAYLKLSSESFIGVLYHDPFGIVVMTGCLFVYVLAIYLSERIGDIKI